MAESRRLALARQLAAELRRREGRNLVAVGVYGSVALGKERPHSDLDLLVVVRRRRPSVGIHVRDGILVTVLQWSPAEAKEEVRGARPDLNAALGGWRSMRPLYDPTGLLRRLRAHARRPGKLQFRGAAARALLETYEDLGKLRNAAASGDLEEAREMAIWFTGGAIGALFNLDRYVLPTGRRAFVELKRWGALGRAIRSLRYEPHSLAATLRLAERVWASLRRRARLRGIPVDEIA